MRVTYRFDEISQSRLVRTKCKRCGRIFQRTFKESQTVNPYNRNADGFVKTAEEIVRECRAKVDLSADKFERYPYCSKCAEVAR